MSELADIREAIGLLLDGIPALRSVSRYERGDIPTNQLPAASIFLSTIGRPDHDRGDIPSLGTGDFKAEWRINIRLGAVMPQYEIAAQQLFETLHTQLRRQLATTTGMLVGDATNNTWISLLTAGGIHVPSDATEPFVAVFTLTTLTLT